MTYNIAPLKRTHVAAYPLQEVDGNFDESVKIDIELNDFPDAEWRAIFASNPTGIPVRNSFTIAVMGKTIEGLALEPRFEEYVDHIDQRIAAANDAYAQQVIPERERQEAKRIADEEELNRKMKEVQDRADRFNEPREGDRKAG